MGKSTICIGENKDADQLRGNREADQRHCFRYSDSTTKTQISFVVTAKLISAFVFATRIVQFLFYLNPKFQESISFLCLYRPVCVGPVRKPHCWFSHEVAHILTKHFLKSLGSIPGRARFNSGRTCDGPSGYHFPAFNIDRATDTIQLIQAISRWGSIRVSNAG